MYKNLALQWNWQINRKKLLPSSSLHWISDYSWQTKWAARLPACRLQCALKCFMRPWKLLFSECLKEKVGFYNTMKSRDSRKVSLDKKSWTVITQMLPISCLLVTVTPPRHDWGPAVWGPAPTTSYLPADYNVRWNISCGFENIILMRTHDINVFCLFMKIKIMCMECINCQKATY